MANLDQQDVGGVRVVRLSGSLTQSGVEMIEPDFKAALPDGTRAVVDLKDVDLITTPGLTLIISNTQRLRQSGGRVVFAAARGSVLDLLRRCRLNEVLDLAGTQEDAVEKAKS